MLLERDSYENITYDRSKTYYIDKTDDINGDMDTVFANTLDLEVIGHWNNNTYITEIRNIIYGGEAFQALFKHNFS